MPILYSIIILLIIIFILRQKEIYHPIKLFSVMSLFLFIYYYLLQEYFTLFSKRFDFFYSFFLLSFFLSYLLFEYIFKYITLINRKNNLLKKHAFYTWKTYYGVCIIFSLYSIIKFISLLIVTKNFSSIRDYIGGEGSLHIGIAYPLCSSMLFYMRENNLFKGRKLIILLILVLCIISTSKQFMLLTILFLFSWQKTKLKLILLIIISGFAFFILNHWLRGHISLSNIKDIMSNSFYQFNAYFIGPFASFQLYLDGLWDTMVTTQKGEWVQVGNYMGNVHTAFKEYYAEKNFLILFSYILAISCIYSFIYSKNTLFYNYMKIYAIFPLYMLYYSDLMIKPMWFSFGLAGLGISLIKKN